MVINQLIRIILLLLGASYVVLEVLKSEFFASSACAVMFVLLTVLYYRTRQEKEKLFFAFLLIFSLSKVLDFIFNIFILDNFYAGIQYYLVNSLFIFSYLLLILRCLRFMPFKEIFSKFYITIAVLVVLSVFCVTLITETTESVLTDYEYYLEFLYNTVVMILLSISLLNYMYRGDDKAMLFFIGTMFIFFSEMIQLAYNYIDDVQHLAAIYSILLVAGFILYYRQSQLELKKPVELFTEEQFSN